MAANSYNDLQKAYLETVLAAGSSATENANDISDPRLLQFEREVLGTYGDTISVASKAKSLIKFGKNPAASTSSETVWEAGGNEVYVSTNIIDTVSSDNTNDTEELKIEGHTVTGTGVNQVFTFVVQTITLTGQTKATLATPLARVSRVYNNGTAALVGNVYVYEDGAITTGTPDNLATVHASIVAGQQQTFKAATTFSGTDYCLLTNVTFGVTKGSGASVVDFFVELRAPGKVFRPVYLATVSNTNASFVADLNPGIIVPKNYDVRVTCVGSAAALVEAQFGGYLAAVIS